MTRGRARLAPTPSSLHPRRKREITLGLFGCLGVILLVVALLALSIAVFTFVLNIVLGIFNGPTLDIWQGAAVYVLLWMIGGFFKAATNSARQ